MSATVSDSNSTDSLNDNTLVELASGDNSGNKQNVNASKEALVKDTTSNTSLASLDTKTPSLGQALAASSTPVVLTAAQLATLTPLTSVTVTQATGTNLHTVVDSSALPPGASTSTLQTTGNTSLSNINTLLADTTSTGTITSIGGGLNIGAEGKASVTIDVTGTFSATIIIEAQNSSGTWNAVPYLDLSTAPPTLQNNITTATRGVVIAGGYSNLRVRPSAFVSGTATIGLEASTSPQGVYSVLAIVPRFASAPATASIGVASTTVIAANLTRTGLVIQNTSSLATVSLNLAGGTAVLNSGITLYPHDIYYMDRWTFTTSLITAISSIAATPVAIQEMT